MLVYLWKTLSKRREQNGLKDFVSNKMNVSPNINSGSSYFQRAYNSIKTVAQSVKSGLNEFGNWLMSKVPEPIKQIANSKIWKLKEQVASLDRFNEFNFDDDLYRTDNASLVGNFI